MSVHVFHYVENLVLKNFSIANIVYNLYLNSKRIGVKNTIAYVNSDQYFNKIKFKLCIKKFHFLELFNFLKINKVDIIHIHNIWNIYNFVLLVFSKIANIKVIISTHGTFLEPALNKKYLKKKIYIMLIRLFMGSNCYFHAQTNDEIKIIKINFNNKIFKLLHPIDYKIIKPLKKLNKKMIFFGRINKFKNIDKIIEGFLKANLTSDWKLEIYGIQEDKSYFNSLKKKYRSYKNVILKKPIFSKKEKFLVKKWININFSESETIGQSIIESAFYYLPSLVPKHISIEGWRSNGGVVTNHNIKSLSKKIKEVSNWSKIERFNRGVLINRFVLKNFNSKKVISFYTQLYNKI